MAQKRKSFELTYKLNAVASAEKKRFKKNHDTRDIERGIWPTTLPSFTAAMACSSCTLPSSTLEKYMTV